MLRRGAVVSAVGRVLMAAGPASGQDAANVPSLDSDKALVEVKVPSAALYHRLYAEYDFAHAVQKNGDGSVSTDVLVNAEERALLRAAGVRFVRTLEDEDATLAAKAAREAARSRELEATELPR